MSEEGLRAPQRDTPDYHGRQAAALANDVLRPRLKARLLEEAEQREWIAGRQAR